MKMMTSKLLLPIITGLVFATPVLGQGQVGSGTSRGYGWDQSIQPVSPAQIPMAPPIQTTPTGYGDDPYRPVYTAQSTTRSRLDPGSGSLWSEGSLYNSPFDFEPVDTYRVGDHIVVKVKDDFQSQQDTRYKNEVKTSGVNLDVRRFFWHDFTEVGNDPFLNLDVNAREKYDGTSRGDISSAMTVDVQTEVKRILPDGRLLLEGRTSRIIGRDIRQVLITGIAQPEDIDYDTKSVDGERVLDMQVKWEGNGPGPNVLKPGFFFRLLDYVPLF